MDFVVREWKKDFSATALAEVAALWNANALGRHAFYPWSGELLAAQLGGGKGMGRLIEARDAAGGLAGFTHVTMLGEEGYPRAGAVEMLLVDSGCRNRGIGTELSRQGVLLLEAQNPQPELLDALGAWPYGYAYNVLVDGSERSGVFLHEESLYRLFRRGGFLPVRKSFVMRADLSVAVPGAIPAACDFYVARRRDTTWLDKVFRGRELWDHELRSVAGQVLSRSIYGFMAGESRQEGRKIYSLFGVNTPPGQQRRGYAASNIAHLLTHIAGLGGEVMELHVYADNIPALRLYRRLGFREIAETMMMRR